MVAVKIYTLMNPTNNKVFYVGRAVDLKTRLSGHISDRYGKSRKNEIIKAIISDGMLPIIEEVDSIICINSKDEVYANKMEEYWINQFLNWGFDITNTNGIKRGYNIMDTKIKWSYYDKDFGVLKEQAKKLEFELFQLEKAGIPEHRNTILGRKSWIFDIKKKRQSLTFIKERIKEKDDFYYQK